MVVLLWKQQQKITEMNRFEIYFVGYIKPNIGLDIWVKERKE
jgi:hypothetical protein